MAKQIKHKQEKSEKANTKKQNQMMLIVGIVILVILIIILGFYFYQQPSTSNSNRTTSQNNTPQVSVNQSQPQPIQNSTPSNTSTPPNASNQTKPPKTISGFCYDGTPVGECNNQGQYCTISHTFVYDCNGNPTLGIPACGCGTGLKCITSGAQTGECLPS